MRRGAGRAGAVVIGGSIGGLLAARVLADHFERVTVIERDEVSGVAQRRGVPQGRHAHGILAAGRRVIDRLFPGISDRLIEHGALAGDVVRDVRWFLEGACLSRVTSGLDALLMSRPLLEAAVRARVRQLPNVRLLDDRAVTGLVSTPDRRRVIGVYVGDDLLEADLVIDATGRGSRSPQWLRSLGYDAPTEERIEIGLSYTTRWFHRAPGDLNGDLAAVIPPSPDRKRGGVMLAQEDNRWIVTLLAHFEGGAPTGIDGFIEYAATLAAPDIHHVIRRAEAVGEPAVAQFPSSVWRRYDRLGRFPEGYLVFGDAISSFNPRYGQGMSVAALQAMELHRTLEEPSVNLAPHFLERAAKVIEIPWAIAAGNDLRMQETLGRRPLKTRLLNWYMARLQRAAHRDPAVSLAFHQVANLLATPQSLLRPGVAMRVLHGNLSRSWELGRLTAGSTNRPARASNVA